MAAIASLSHNMVVGCSMGSFGVMVAIVAARTGIKTETALLAGPLLMLGAAFSAPFLGDLIARRSLRMLMFAGAMLSLVGFVLLAFVPSAPVYFAVYLLLFGPSMTLAGSVGPATLVTRWFDRHRGLALGLVHVNLIVAAMPLLFNWLLEAFPEHGAQVVYLVMALLVGAILAPVTLAIRNFPPDAGQSPAAAAHAASVEANALTLGQIARSPAFWGLAVAASAIIACVMVLTFTIVTMAEGMGFTRGQGAALQSIMSFSGMVGSVLFGWVADRLGGIRGLALLAVDFAILMSLLMIKLPYEALVVLVGLLGLHGAGMVPNVSRALASTLGQGSFSRAFGLSSFLSVPFTAIAIAGMAFSHDRTGSYAPALAGLVILLIAVVPLVLSVGRQRKPKAIAA
jgi:MFS family permease